MATKESTKNISVLRKRDYSEVFKWNATLNEDLYHFYLKAREKPQQGYMRRLKSLWDEKYSTYNYLSEKHLLEQASFIHSKTTRIVGQEISSEETPHANEMNNNLNNSINPRDYQEHHQQPNTHMQCLYSTHSFH